MIMFTAGLLLMLTTIFAATADASQPLQKIEIVTEEAEGTVTVSVYAEFAFASETAVLDSFQFDLEYDDDAFCFSECCSTGGAPESEVLDSSFLWSVNCIREGTLTFAAASVGGTQDSGLMARFVFTVDGAGDASEFVLNNVAYSTYDTSANVQNTYKFAEASQPQVDAPIDVEAVPVPETEAEENGAEESVSGWTRLIRSIFGESCCSADESR